MCSYGKRPRSDTSTMTQASEILDGSSTLTPFEEGTLSLLALTKPCTIVTRNERHRWPAPVSPNRRNPMPLHVNPQIPEDPYHPETSVPYLSYGAPTAPHRVEIRTANRNHSSVTIRSHAIYFAIIIEATMAVPDGITRHVPSEWARECGALYTRSGQV